MSLQHKGKMAPSTSTTDTTLIPILNHARLILGGEHTLRVVEAELYLHHPERWPDPYVHGHPFQREPSQWYFHRAGSSLRQGTFKGLDLTLGDGHETHAGLLIRSVETSHGKLICGPCNCVHHIMQTLGIEALADLEAQARAHDATSDKNILSLQTLATETKPLTVYHSARVGLSLKRVATHPEMPRFILSRQRFVARPSIAKGRYLTTLAMIEDGVLDDAEIARLTGTSIRAIEHARQALATPYHDALPTTLSTSGTQKQILTLHRALHDTRTQEHLSSTTMVR